MQRLNIHHQHIIDRIIHTSVEQAQRPQQYQLPSSHQPCMSSDVGMDFRWIILQVRHELFFDVTCKTFYVSIPMTTAAPAIKELEDG